MISRHPLAGFSLLWYNDTVQNTIIFQLILLKLWLILSKILAVQRLLLQLKFYVSVRNSVNTDKSKLWHFMASCRYPLFSISYDSCKGTCKFCIVRLLTDMECSNRHEFQFFRNFDSWKSFLWSKIKCDSCICQLHPPNNNEFTTAQSEHLKARNSLFHNNKQIGVTR